MARRLSMDGYIWKAILYPNKELDVTTKGWQVVDGKMKYIPPKVEPLQRTSLDIPAPQDVVDYMHQRAVDFRQGR